MISSAVRLFKCIPLREPFSQEIVNDGFNDILKKTISRGFLLSPNVLNSFHKEKLNEIVDIVSKELGISGEELNNSFHKSWGKVKNASIIQLVIEQLFHYITTYGYEKLDIYNKDTVYIPTEKLEIPKIDINEIKLTVINGYTLEEIKEKVFNLLSSGIALKEETTQDIIKILHHLNLTDSDIANIKNNEVRCILYDLLIKTPSDPVELLRVLVYKSTDSTLLIKNRDLIDKIKESYDNNLQVLFRLEEYINKFGIKRLAEIFYRYKPLFLALRHTNPLTKKYINKIRRLAKIYHKPLKEDFLNSITCKLKQGKSIDLSKLKSELENVNSFRKIRLLYALKYYTLEPKAITYKIRNGKAYSKELSDKHHLSKEKVKQVVYTIIESIVKDIKPNVNGKKVYIPKDIVYSLPISEKQFNGNFPTGTRITLPQQKFIFGVHWFNYPPEVMKSFPNNDDGYYDDYDRVDLDLSLIDEKRKKIGWDAQRRTDEVLFSGDMTDALQPHGASELYHITTNNQKEYLVLLNFYNHELYGELENQKVPFSLVFAKGLTSDEKQDFEKNYMIDPNKVLYNIKSNIKYGQKTIGFIKVDENKQGYFYFMESLVGKNITSIDVKHLDYAVEYLKLFYSNTINLKVLLKHAGAIFVDTPEKSDIDLSYEKLEKDSLIKLFINQK